MPSLKPADISDQQTGQCRHRGITSGLGALTFRLFPWIHQPLRLLVWSNSWGRNWSSPAPHPRARVESVREPWGRQRWKKCPGFLRVLTAFTGTDPCVLRSVWFAAISHSCPSCVPENGLSPCHRRPHRPNVLRLGQFAFQLLQLGLCSKNQTLSFLTLCLDGAPT